MMGVTNRAVSVYFAAGISMLHTSILFREAMRHLERRYKNKGYTSVRVQCFFPYGTIDDVPASRYKWHVAGQVYTVGRDIYRKAAHTVGGQALYKDICMNYDRNEGGPIVLIGHSGGGIASYKAAQLLDEQGYPVAGVFMVGSPEIPICASCRDKVFAIEHGGRWGDWISRCSFHWFQPAKVRVRLPINGGHHHYFCNKSKDEHNVTNLEKVMDYIWGWVQGESEVVYNQLEPAK